MSGLSIVRRFNLAAHGFAAAREGNIAVTFAIALLPLLGFVGAAMDYSRAAKARSSMQAALDSTSVMLLKDLSTGTITQSQISAKAVSYFTALYTNKDAQGISIRATYTPGSGTTGNAVTVDGTGSIVTDFMKIAGFPTMGFNATSTFRQGNQLAARGSPNTGDRWYGKSSSPGLQVDPHRTALCVNVKAGGVTIYSVQIDADGAGQPAVLPNCTSNPSNSVTLTQPSQIGTEIAKLRVAK